jgi:hypothetical protein
MNHELEKLVANLQERDNGMVSEMTNWMGDGMTLEKRVTLADARAVDALAAVAFLCRYIVKMETSQEPK